jgi:predicted RNA binding protein YcfA (HicA-like mRNA interferase family)
VPLNPLPYSTVKRKLEAAGFTIVSQKGSHVKFVKQVTGGKRTAIVPKHKTIAIGTLSSILRQAGISAEEFERL